MDVSRQFDRAQWRTSTQCSSGGCVEVAVGQDMVGMRDAKDRSGPVLVFDASAWSEFVAGIRRGEFDLPGWSE